MKRKLLSLVLTLAMLASLLTPAFAAQGASFTDTDGHWAQASVDRWAGAGVMNGTGSGFQPDKTMTRAEFAQMLVNLLGYTEKAQNTFKDVPNDAWFADAVLKLAAAGVMQGDGVNANPNAEISRAEMAVLLCRALNIQPKAASSLSFADAASVPSWAEGAMAALAERGMISGVGGNQVAPTLSVNRASVAKLLDNVVGVYANEPGQVISGEVKGLVIVVADGVTLKDAAVAENIVVAPKAGGASLTVTGKSTVADVYVAADGAKLTVDKDAAAGDILVDAAKAAVTVDGKADAVMTTESASSAALSVGGTVSSVSLAGADTELKVSGTVKSVDISATASGADVNVAKGGSIDTVKTSADDVKIAGEGTVKSVEVTAGSGVAVDTKGTEVTVDKNADSVTEYTVYYDDGSGNESYFLRQTVTAGGKTTAPSPAPTKDGYTFGGWDKDKACTAAWDFANDTVTSNVTLYAKWVPDEHTVTVHYNFEGAPANKVYTVSYGVAMEEPEAPARDLYSFVGWYDAPKGGSAWDFNAPVLGDMDLYAQWSDNFWTVKLHYQDGETADKNIYAVRGTPAVKPADPTRDHYSFAGWYTEDAYTSQWDFDANVTGNLNLYAKWEPLLTVTFDSKGGTAVDKLIDLNKGDKVTAPKAPTKDGYTFEGWYTDEAYSTKWDFDAGKITADTTLYARWAAPLSVEEKVQIADKGKYYYNVFYADGKDVTVRSDGASGLFVTVGNEIFTYAKSATGVAQTEAAKAEGGLVIFAGGKANTAAIEMNPSITIESGKVAVLFGGGYQGDVKGTTTITVADGAAVGSIYGGGLISNGDKTSKAQLDKVVLDIRGTVGLIYAGGQASVDPAITETIQYNSTTPTNSTANCYVGEAKVTISATAKVTYYFGSSYSYGGIGSVVCDVYGQLGEPGNTGLYSAVSGANGFTGSAAMTVHNGAQVGTLYTCMRGYIGEITLNIAEGGAVDLLSLMPDGKNVGFFGNITVANSGTVAKCHYDCGCAKAGLGSLKYFPATLTVTGIDAESISTAFWESNTSKTFTKPEGMTIKVNDVEVNPGASEA